MGNIIAETGIHDSIVAISSAISVVVGALMTWAGKKYLDRREIKQLEKKSKEIDSSLKKNKLVQSCVRNARNSLECDRAIVMEYHNGEIFASKNHFLKMSCSFESLDNGITSVSRHFMNIPYSIFHDWSVGTIENPFVAYVNEMDASETQNNAVLMQMLAEGGTETYLSIPLTDNCGREIGFVGFHYLAKTYLNQEKIDLAKIWGQKISKMLSSSKPDIENSVN